MVYTTKICKICNIVKPIEEFNKNKKHSDGHTSVCKDCCNEELRERYGNDLEYREKIMEKNRIAVAKYRAKEGFIPWYKRSQENLETQREHAKKSRQKDRYIVIEHYSNGTMKCICCGENHYDFLTIDHMNNDGANQKRENKLAGNNMYKWLINNGFPKEYQVLCMNCNWSKRLNGGKCIHMIEREELV